MKRILTTLLCVCVLFSACEKPTTPTPTPDPGTEVPTPDPEPTPEPEPTPKVEKDRSLWVSATVNWSRLRTKVDIKTWVKRIKNNGFNEIILEVKLMEGGVLYESDILPMRTEYNGITRNFDYLQYFIEQCHANGMRLGAAMTVFPTYGLGETAKYKDSDFEGRYCQEILSSAGVTDIRNNPNDGIFPFLNPADAFVRQFVMDVVEEIVTKYDVDSFTLDYCRYQNYHSDFSETTREAFQKAMGVMVKNWPEDLYRVTDDGKDVFGPQWNQFVEWRTSVITGYVEEIGRRIKAIRPDCKFEYWAASWWPLWSTGQNWTSDKKNLTGSYWWATPDYYKTGFAKYLDVFQNGAYMKKLFPEYDGETVSYQLSMGKSYIKGDCRMYGSYTVAGIDFDPGEAAHWCLKNTDGLMVFELCHVDNNSYWSSIKAGITAAIEDGSAYVQ